MIDNKMIKAEVMGKGLAKHADLSIEDLAKHFLRSGYFKDVNDVSKAVVKIVAGRELGLPPFASMQGFYIVEGKPSLAAGTMGALIKRYRGADGKPKYDYRVTKHTNEECVIEFHSAVTGEVIGASSFTLADARAAGLAGKQTWQKFARNLLFARALSNGARWHCPDVFAGPIYTPEEMAPDGQYNEDGEPIGMLPAPAVEDAAYQPISRRAEVVEGVVVDEPPHPADCDPPCEAVDGGTSEFGGEAPVDAGTPPPAPTQAPSPVAYMVVPPDYWKHKGDKAKQEAIIGVGNRVKKIEGAWLVIDSDGKPLPAPVRPPAVKDVPQDKNEDDKALWTRLAKVRVKDSRAFDQAFSALCGGKWGQDVSRADMDTMIKSIYVEKMEGAP